MSLCALLAYPMAYSLSYIVHKALHELIYLSFPFKRVDYLIHFFSIRTVIANSVVLFCFAYVGF
jgi:ABC-type spermidine/putrescine transport system permease subunit I